MYMHIYIMIIVILITIIIVIIIVYIIANTIVFIIGMRHSQMYANISYLLTTRIFHDDFNLWLADEPNMGIESIANAWVKFIEPKSLRAN